MPSVRSPSSDQRYFAFIIWHYKYSLSCFMDGWFLPVAARVSSARHSVIDVSTMETINRGLAAISTFKPHGICIISLSCRGCLWTSEADLMFFQHQMHNSSKRSPFHCTMVIDNLCRQTTLNVTINHCFQCVG